MVCYFLWYAVLIIYIVAVAFLATGNSQIVKLPTNAMDSVHTASKSANTYLTTVASGADDALTKL